ncbi:MAG: substrate-binding domain-containing protein [Blautia marasmi]
MLRALYEKKIRVPEDISVIGYDDTIAKFLSRPFPPCGCRSGRSRRRLWMR